MNLVLRHLNLGADGAPRPPSGTNAPNNGLTAASPYPSPWLSPHPSNIDPPAPPPASSMAYSLDHSNVDGAEALLAQTETTDDYYPLPTPGGSTQPINTPPGTGLYHLLDDLINTAPINATSSAAAKHGEGLGESDPRSDIVKSGVVSLLDANVLVDQSVAFAVWCLLSYATL